jgi:uncharacterized membrane protein YeiH
VPTIGTIEQFQVPLWIELVAAGLGGLQGALFAAGYGDRRIDVLGVVVIGLAVALGGSLLRDIVLDQPPRVIWVNWYLLVAGASAVVGMALQPTLLEAGWLIRVLDAVAMGIFGAIGASKALLLGVGDVGALVVGAIGGGRLRDLLLDRPTSFLHVGTLYAVAAGAGAGTFILLVRVDVPVPIAGAISTATTAVVRLAAIRLDWSFPSGAQRAR